MTPREPERRGCMLSIVVHDRPRELVKELERARHRLRLPRAERGAGGCRRRCTIPFMTRGRCIAHSRIRHFAATILHNGGWSRVMSIEYRIDHERRTVFAKGRDTFTDADAFGYQRDVWSRPELAGYHELMDMTDVTAIDSPARTRVRDLATLSAAMDPPTAAVEVCDRRPGGHSVRLRANVRRPSRVESAESKRGRRFPIDAGGVKMAGRGSACESHIASASNLNRI